MALNSRRAVNGLLAAAISVMVVAIGSPAGAEAPTPGLRVTLPNQALAPGDDGKVIHPEVRHGGSGEVAYANLTMKVDASGLAGMATVSAADPHATCSPAAAVITCTPDSGVVGEFGASIQFALAAATGALVGARGTLKVTVTADGVAPAEHTATVTIAEVVDLTDATRDSAFTRSPGESIEVPFAVQNSGAITVDNTLLIVRDEYAIAPAKRYSNCEYALRDLVCRFDTDLAAGRTYRLSEQMRFLVRPDTEAPGERAKQFSWETPDDPTWLDGWRAQEKPVAGNGVKLGLVAVNEVSADSQTDTNRGDNAGALKVTVTGRNAVDLAAVGAEVFGDAGTTVEATVGVKDVGAATADTGGAPEPVARATVVAPPGTTVVAAPKDCAPKEGDNVDLDKSGQPGARQYECTAPPFLAAGDTYAWRFDLRIDEKIANAAGSVTLAVLPRWPGDRANDTAKILVNGPKPTPSTSPSPGPTPGPGTGGGGLPTTGANVALTLGVGVLLVVLGAAGYRIGRRRRARFTA